MDPLATELSALRTDDPYYAVAVVDRVLRAAQERQASDLHLTPFAEGLELRLRVDGVLQTMHRFPAAAAANVVSRLKVVAELLTYRTDVPQEGRIRGAPGAVEMRVSTFPTLYGERAVVRLFGGRTRLQQLDDLGLPAEIRTRLGELLGETAGAILATGPAGCGKTTTMYACLRELAGQGGIRNLVSLEDPVEVAIGGVGQTQVNAAAGLDLATGLRFLLRQDPEVIFVGEIRDRATAEAALQASLTGHLLLSTFHAGSAAEAVGRLSDMGIEPYMLRSGILAILSQRLVRRLCDCRRPATDAADRLGLAVSEAYLSVGCAVCRGSGYRGRQVIAELLVTERSDLGRAILSRSDAGRLEALAEEAGMVTRWQRACRLIEEGITSPAEVRRVLGFASQPGGGV